MMTTGGARIVLTEAHRSGLRTSHHAGLRELVRHVLLNNGPDLFVDVRDQIVGECEEEWCKDPCDLELVMSPKDDPESRRIRRALRHVLTSKTLDEAKAIARVEIERHVDNTAQLTDGGTE